MISPWEKAVKLLINQPRDHNVTEVYKKDYETFCNEYIFDAIRGRTFGKAFCNKFNVTDYYLLVVKDVYLAKTYIEHTYIV
mgnify:CR=1 FL=1